MQVEEWEIWDYKRVKNTKSIHARKILGEKRSKNIGKQRGQVDINIESFQSN